MPVEFTIVERDPPPAPAAPVQEEAPGRPTASLTPGLALVAIFILLCAGGLVLVTGAIIALTYAFVDRLDSFDTLVLMVLMAVFALGLAAGFVGIRLWEGANWARILLIVVLAAFGAAAATLALLRPDTAPRAMIGLVVTAAAVGTLTHRSAVTYCAEFDRRAALPPVPAGRRASTRFVAWFLGAAGAALLVWLALTPAQSLMSSADGATLARDAMLGMVPAALVLWAGAHLASRGPYRWGVAAAGIGGALLVATLLLLSADAAAREPLVNGVATGGETPRLLLKLFAYAAVAAHGVLLIVLRDAKRATLPVVAAACIAFGAGILVANLGLILNEGSFQMAAQARERYSTPGPGLWLALAAVLLAAWARRREA